MLKFARQAVGLSVLGLAGVAALYAPLSAKSVQATPITVTALAHNSQADFSHAAHLPYANPNAPKGGTLSQAAIGTFDSMQKWIDVGTPAAGTDYLYDTLMTGSLSEAFVMYPQLADKVTYDPDDASWIVYHINPHAKFWDGSPVTAQDVKASLEAVSQRGIMAMRSYLADIDHIQVIDDKTVKFYFKTKDNREIGLLVGQMPIWQKASIDASFDKVSLTPLMGSGAYRLGKIEPGRSVTYVRDPNYWGAKPEAGVMANVGRYNFDTIKFVYYQNPEVAFEGFKAGQYQFRTENKARTWATGYDFPAVKAGLVIKEAAENYNPVPMQGIVINLRRPLFADIRVREALTLAYDFEWLNKTMFYGQYERLQSYFHHSELAATGTPSAAELAVLQPWLASFDPIYRQAVLADWRAPVSNGGGFNRANLLKARQLLLDAGFFYRDMHLYQPNGQPAQVEFLSADEKNAREILPFLRNLERLGFTTTLRQVDMPQYLERKRKFDYDLIVDVFGQSLSPGAEQVYMWGSQAADEIGNQNTAGIKNPAIDAVIDKLTRADNRDDIVLYTHVLDRLLRAGYYIVPMYGKRADNLAYWQQYQHAALPSNGVSLDYWWVDQAKQTTVQQYLAR